MALFLNVNGRLLSLKMSNMGKCRESQVRESQEIQIERQEALV